ncbi:hypothetical protein M0805_002719, partial [Coniferiporia weirii]
DLSDGNVMMDGRPLFGPDGFHPSHQHKKAVAPAEDASPQNRRDVGPINYYITDFGLSTHFENDVEPRLTTGAMAQDRDVPEISSYIPYDPFCVDVFTLGMVYKRNFLDVYTNTSFLAPLISRMTRKEPKERLTAGQALELFSQLVAETSGYSLRWRLCPSEERIVPRIARDIQSVLRELSFMTKSAATITNPRKVLAFTFFPITFGFFLLSYGPRNILARVRGTS